MIQLPFIHAKIPGNHITGKIINATKVGDIMTEKNRLITVTLTPKIEVLKAMQLIKALDILHSLAKIGSFPPFHSHYTFFSKVCSILVETNALLLLHEDYLQS
uniref:Uncharacterized protein n=1 Tax=Nicotiana tabacum TaxID=4097 RepID=A0A1S4ATT1_TOBAC|nr:PREDICTED: uncharacterized protein LOC107801208 [Nicotiana tabacum]